MFHRRIAAAPSVVAALLIVGGCSDRDAGVSPPPGDHPDSQYFDTAPDSLAVAGTTLRLAAFLWRDFMPIVEPDGRALAGQVRITSDGAGELPAGLEIENVLVRFEDQVWDAGRPNDQRLIFEGRILEGTVWGGPKWGPGVPADVLVRLGTPDGKDWFLVVHKVTIQQTA